MGITREMSKLGALLRSANRGKDLSISGSSDGFVTNNYVGRNKIINGNFDIWQRGTSFSSPANGTYTADRWVAEYDGTIGTYSVSRQAFTLGQTDVPNEPSYYLRWNHTAAGSGSTYRQLRTKLESVKTLANKTVTLSFYAKADTSRTLSVWLQQYFGTGGSPSSSVVTSTTNCSLTTSWQRFTATFTLASLSGKTIGTLSNDYLAVYFSLPVNTTMTIDIAQVQLEEGSVATNFELLDITDILIKCQRYYERGGMGFGDNTTVDRTFRSPYTGGLTVDVRFQTMKRTNPGAGVVVYAQSTGTANNWRDQSSNTDVAASVSVTTISGFTTVAATNDGSQYAFTWAADIEL